MLSVHQKIISSDTARNAISGISVIYKLPNGACPSNYPAHKPSGRKPKGTKQRLVQKCVQQTSEQPIFNYVALKNSSNFLQNLHGHYYFNVVQVGK